MCGSVKVSDKIAIQELMANIGMPSYLASQFELNDKLFPYFKPLLAGFLTETMERDCAMMNWGWRREWDEKKRLFNCRRVSKKGQVIWRSPLWSDAINNRRCLIPVNAFYEWDQNQPKGKRERYRIETKQAAFTLGGIYEISQDGELFFSICTTEPNQVMANIHHRMPVIIDKDESETWLHTDNIEEVDQLMQPKSDDYIVMHKENQLGKTQSLF